ncbi:MAG TPA: TonB-dependent receptor [Xanthomonadaceae bacterium]|jgi:outer membrane receptor protein involved in Fe transport
MTIKRNNLRDAINVALTIGAASMVSMGAAYAQDATPAPAPTDKAKQLDTVMVTGSRVRRVDQETASPVLILDRKAIEKTGKMTIGEIVNELPSISGAPVTAAVNNGGGTGAATADMRGLGSQRTLVLIDGHRPGPTPVDLNTIPLDLVERIEVLTEGSSTVYGSDAIGGVINFIMRKNYNGAEYQASYGESGRHDSNRKGQSFMFGQSGDKGNVTAGVEYNKFDAVPAGNREFAANALYHTYGSIVAIGSSRNPNGRIFLPPATKSPLQGQFGCSSVSRTTGTSGTSLGDYHCYSGATDGFNFQPFNVVLTPQERTNAFALANYNLTDDISAYVDFYHQKQTSQSQIAPLAFDANSDGVTVSKDSIYNPFGVDIGAATGYEFFSRFSNLGQRIFNNTTNNDVLFAGFKGNFGQTWSWDAGFDYNHFSFTTEPEGYINLGSLAQALGPSMVIGGTPTCVATAGDPTSAIAGCTPLNLFNLTDPNTIAELNAASVNPISTTSFVEREVEFNTSGDLFDLPAGAAKLAVGGDSRKEYENVRVDPLTKIPSGATGCALPQETCGTPLQGGFDLKEVYGELFVPILKDQPFFYQLNLDLGTRYSKYNIFKGNDSNKVALEWRPIKDLLLRGSASDVFRAPTAADLFSGAVGGAFPYGGDPCVGLAGATNWNGHAAACGTARGTTSQGPIPGNGLGQVTGVAEGSTLGGFNLQPEKGRSYDFGFVYDPDFVPGLSTSFDYYRITLNNNIGTLDPSVGLNDCFNNTASPYCQYIHRVPNGQISFITLPTVNLGTLSTHGFDFAIKYKMPVTPWGQFSFSADFTHISEYDIGGGAQGTGGFNGAPPNDEPLHLAGEYKTGFGNFFKWRGNAGIDWSKGNWNAGYRIRWVGKGRIGNADPDQNTSADGCNYHTGGTYGYCPLAPAVVKIPNYFESYLTAGYNFGAIGSMDSRVDVGVDNVFDKQPPIFTQSSVTNGNVDVSTYDTIGRLFWARFTAKF